MSFRCSTCGDLHEDLPHVGMDKPDHYWDVPEEERDERINFTSDTCIIDNEDYFIRGVIEIHVHGSPENFGFGVWVSQKKENFYTYLENFDTSEIGPFFGWLCTDIGYYPEETQLLKTMVYFQGDGLRPCIELESTEHPLAVAQRDGITLEEAWKIVHFYLDSGERDA
jgi:hypothetical protein